MGKKTVTMLLLIVLAVSAFTVSAGAEGGVSIMVDGAVIDFADAYLNNGTTYVPLRPVAESLGATAVVWNGDTRTALIMAPDLTIEASDGAVYIIANGRYIYVPEGVAVCGGKTMVPVRAVARAFGAQVQWLAEERTVSITSGNAALAPAGEFYSETDVYWLSRIIQAEAGDESLEGKIAVANVVQNRVKSDEFPDTVKSVIFDKRYGIQFTPAYSGAIYKDPGTEAVIAAKLALDGASTGGESLYFVSAKSAPYSWAAKNRQVFAQIDSQIFYI